jgi:hypothetical protein
VFANVVPCIIIQLWFFFVVDGPCVVLEELICGRESWSVRGSNAVSVY